MNVSTPHVQENDAREVAYVSFFGNYLGNTRVFENLFGTLCGWAGERQLIMPETIFLSAYYDDPDTTPPEELRVDVCMTIPPRSAHPRGRGDTQTDTPGREICRDTGGTYRTGGVRPGMVCDGRMDRREFP